MGFLSLLQNFLWLLRVTWKMPRWCVATGSRGSGCVGWGDVRFRMYEVSIVSRLSVMPCFICTAALFIHSWERVETFNCWYTETRACWFKTVPHCPTTAHWLFKINGKFPCIGSKLLSSALTDRSCDPCCVLSPKSEMLFLRCSPAFLACSKSLAAFKAASLFFFLFSSFCC